MIADVPDTGHSNTVEVETLNRLVDEALDAMLDLPFKENACGQIEPTHDLLQATIYITGDWESELRILASQNLANQIACAMFATDLADLDESEVVDALGEIVNVIGGNVKGLVKGDCHLSLPSVGKPSKEIPTRNVRSTFACNDERLHAILIEN